MPVCYSISIAFSKCLLSNLPLIFWALLSLAMKKQGKNAYWISSVMTMLTTVGSLIGSFLLENPFSYFSR